MIAIALRAEIERYAARMRAANPLFARAAAGTLGADHLVRYLANVHLLLQASPHQFTAAVRRSRELGEHALAEHFIHKGGEEAGHERWSARDVERVSATMSTRAKRDALPAIVSMLRFIDEIIQEDPAQFLSYILFSEYLIVLMGPEWLEHLEARCGIPRTSMTSVGNHAKLDVEHSEEAFESIDQLVAEPRKLSAMRRVLLQTMQHFDQFCTEVVQLGDEARYAAAIRTPAA